MTSHSASSKQKEFGRARARVKQNKPAHIVRSKRTDRMRERAHTPRSVVPLLYSIPIVMHFFLSYIFAVAHSRILEYFKF